MCHAGVVVTIVNACLQQLPVWSSVHPAKDHQKALLNTSYTVGCWILCISALHSHSKLADLIWTTMSFHNICLTSAQTRPNLTKLCTKQMNVFPHNSSGGYQKNIVPSPLLMALAVADSFTFSFSLPPAGPSLSFALFPHCYLIYQRYSNLGVLKKLPTLSCLHFPREA